MTRCHVLFCFYTPLGEHRYTTFRDAATHRDPMHSTDFCHIVWHYAKLFCIFTAYKTFFLSD